MILRKNHPKTTCLLLIEHDTEFLLRMADAVGQDDQLVLTAAVSLGAAAMELMAQQAPDVLVLDLTCSPKQAFDVIRHTAMHYPATDMVLITHVGDKASLLASMEAGAKEQPIRRRAIDRLATCIHRLRSGSASCQTVCVA
jgi:DNA-binding NarL/FixJ family response regulator